MAKGYIIARASVSNMTQWAQYAAESTKVIAQYGGRVLVRGGQCTVSEGEGRARNIIIEFDSYEQAKAFTFSPEYNAARKVREGAGLIDIVCVEGA